VPIRLPSDFGFWEELVGVGPAGGGILGLEGLEVGGVLVLDIVYCVQVGGDGCRSSVSVAARARSRVS
jgi:hypothetical protein